VVVRQCANAYVGVDANIYSRRGILAQHCIQ
jgi:hypothetical protein